MKLFKKGVEYRETGNEAFKKGDYPAALSDYYHALLHLRTVGGLQPANDLKERPNEQLVKIYNNQCAVLAKQEKWPRVLDTATKAREIDAENFKVVNAAAMTKTQVPRKCTTQPELGSMLDRLFQGRIRGCEYFGWQVQQRHKAFTPFTYI
ncbi:hypothetical protein BDB00DRAFT_857456 [Zychaea mexicana]|uniref:uncharacterized protein n=1 Tax=Zychaea mexicana TaxID=64656 RepID=UPI0022FEAB0B|nr:uncharacterized protein BDB00DRAFT_857456 [Zychaea mexicana]KAI9482567.1 hypothetical protein BDB00DRAFT_857456 [Zychaea mexicana]